jgi:hypothetical protein
MVTLDTSQINEIARYCGEEVRRQYAYSSEPHAIQVAGMIHAWMSALDAFNDGREITPALIEHWGGLIEPVKNRNGFRTVPVFVGMEEKAKAQFVPGLIQKFTENYASLNAFDAYREFEDIHPFIDGNGRTGKIILNWVNGTLYNPIFPPDDFWGKKYVNP